MFNKYFFSLFGCICFVLTGFGQTTVSYDFSATGASTSGSLDANISFTSHKNSGTATPVINSGQLRLYQNATKGGSIKIVPSNGAIITSVVVNASTRTGPAGYTVDGSFVANLSGGSTYTMSSLNASTEVEFYQRDSNSSNRIYVDDFTVTYTMPTSGPTITTSTSSLTGLDYIEGSGPSVEQSYSVSAANLTPATGNITVTAPGNFSISKTAGGTYTNSLTFAYAGGTLSASNVFVRLNSGLVVGTYGPLNVTNTGGGATTQNVAVSGEVTPLCTTPSPATNLVLSNATSSTIDVAFTASGADNYLVVQSTSSTLSVNPTDTNSYTVGNSLGGGTVVFNGSASSFTNSGLSANTTYYYFVFAYNNANCSGGPLYSVSITDNETTLNGPCLSENFQDSNGWSDHSYGNWTQIANNGTWIANGIYAGAGRRIQMNDVGDWLEFPMVDNPVSLNYDYALSSSQTGTNQMQVQYWDGSTWVVAATHTSLGTTFINYSADLSAVTAQTNVRLRLFRSADNRTAYIDNIEVFCGVPGPEIQVEGNNIEITDGDATPSTIDDTRFGNVPIVSGSEAHTFFIKNTGGTPLTINSITSDNAEFTVSGTTNTSIAGGGDASFTVTFDPTTLGTRTAIITIDNDDTDENPYTFSISGNGTNSNLSTIVDNTNYSTTAPEFNITPQYINYIDGTSTSTGKFIPFKIKILDGGISASDADSYSTTLTDLKLTVQDLSNTNQLAMIKTAVLTGTGGAVIATASKVGNELVFSGMSGASVTASDDGQKILHIRASFDENQVIDNTKLIFKISEATADASGSAFANTDAGGAESDSNNNNRNTLNVLGDRLQFTTQPSNTSISDNMLPAPVVAVTDIYGNADLDINSGNISMTSTGTPNAQPSAVITNAQATFTAVNHSASGTGFRLTASYSGWSVTSNLFNINDTANGSYRTTASGTWLSNQASPAIWERFNGSTWAASNSPSYSTTNLVYIRDGHNINTGGSWGNSVHLIINNGGTLNINHQGTAGNLSIQDGGNVSINASLTINSSGILEVFDGGNLTLNFKYGNPNSSLWNGTEKFHPDSNLIFNDWDADDDIIDNNTSITTNTFNGYTAIFGNILIDFQANLSSSDDITFLNSGVLINMAHGDLIFRTNDFGPPSNCPSGVNKFNIATTGSVNSGIGGDFIVEDTFTFVACSNIIQFKISGTLVFTIKGNMSLDQATTRLGAGTNPNTTLNIEGNLEVLSGAFFDMQATSSANNSQTINLHGNLYASNSGRLSCSNNSSSNVVNNNFNFVGTSIQTIDVASTSASENQAITFNVESGASVKQINRDFELGTYSSLNIKGGGTYDFGFDGNTPLNVVTSGTQNTTEFKSFDASTLIITSIDGISKTNSTSNVKTSAYLRTFSQNATFWYVGKQDQITGNGLTTLSSGRVIICDLIDNDTRLFLSNHTGITNNTIANPLGGALDIRVGQFIETETEYITGSTGRLIMADGTLYQIPKPSANSSDLIPRLNNTTIYYQLYGDSTIELNANGSQRLRGLRDYRNLTFSNQTNVTLSNAIANIDGTITTENNAIVDVENKNFGGTTTNLNMKDNSRYITAGSDVEPDAGGTYSLGIDTVIEFNRNTSLEKIRLANPIPNYANVIVSGSHVGTESDNVGIKFQANGNFEVTNTGVFLHNNISGFSGDSGTAIDQTNTPNIILENGSTIEYARNNSDSQTITAFSPEYKNVIISGSGTKILGHPTDILIGENLTLNASTLKVNTDEILTVDESVNRLFSAVFDIENSGSLIQINDASINVGSINMKRTASIKNLDYVYWSSPVEDFTVNNIWTTNRIYKWGPTASNANGTEGNWLNASGNIMTKGLGYILRAPNGTSTAPVDYTTTFLGVPQNGIVEIGVARGNDLPADNDDDNWNLIGNPYPSAISADALLFDHTSIIKGWIKLWTHGDAPNSTFNNTFYQDFVNNYDVQDYITYNYMGPSMGPETFTGYIAAGQAFFVNMVDGPADNTQKVQFKNAYRQKTTTYTNSEFFKTTTNNNTAEKSRIWLDLINETTGKSNRILVGYTADSTLEKDHLYDAENQNTTSQNFYSILNNQPFIVQGRGEFNESDIVPLGIRVTSQGNHYIAIPVVDGLFETQNQTIYLKDYLLNFTHNLSNNPYSFTSAAGTIDNRFEIIYVDNDLSISENELGNNNLTIIEMQNENVKFTLSNSILQIKNVKIYDTLGRLIYNFSGNSNSEIYNLSNLSQAAYIAKVTLSNNYVITKKAIKSK
ncbi:MAG: choice-of-anchor D domain-containing protein [Oceanihabitans sp.]